MFFVQSGDRLVDVLDRSHRQVPTVQNTFIVEMDDAQVALQEQAPRVREVMRIQRWST